MVFVSLSKKTMRILLISCILIVSCQSNGQNDKKKKDFPVQKSEKEWERNLSDQEYYVLREAGTERAFSSELLKIKGAGTFVCAACKNPLYKTKHKFKSGTGWPSFDRAIKGSIAYDSDQKLGYTRKELLCANCGSHLGHVFNDGPQETTGKRHCINGIALDFEYEN
jgi:peptide-methionine (R)-S-oxide reductase